MAYNILIIALKIYGAMFFVAAFFIAVLWFVDSRLQARRDKIDEQVEEFREEIKLRNIRLKEEQAAQSAKDDGIFDAMKELYEDLS